jgi:pantetheine-phosphate adenylyltransferase
MIMSPVEQPNTVLYPGSFDPCTKGHLDVVARLKKIFSNVIVLVADSPRKNYRFSRNERVDLIRGAVEPIGGVEVCATDELTIEFARARGIKVIARSVRTVGDWEYEYSMAYANKKLAPEIETLFIMADPELGFISSSLVREVAQYGGDLSSFVPENVVRALKQAKK